MAWVEKGHNTHPVPTPCYVQGHQPAAQAAQSHIQPGLECLQGWGVHSLLGQPVQCVTTLFCPETSHELYLCLLHAARLFVVQLTRPVYNPGKTVALGRTHPTQLQPCEASAPCWLPGTKPWSCAALSLAGGGVGHGAPG